MRLLKRDTSGQVLLTEFPNEASPPPYAVLSHTWGKEEVTFEDVQNRTNRGKHGYRKIEFCAEQARKDGLDYFWVDTCCIDKSHHTELSESVVSMFRWYSAAAKCYVYMGDVLFSPKRAHDGDTQLWQSSFRESRWFTRGWTLQELLAPSTVEFFSVEGQNLGSKIILQSMIYEITSIPVSALRGAPLSDFTVQERLAWASTRQTTKIEDKAYCLMGIFDVSMSPIYGEREKAIDRLLREISVSQMPQLYQSGQALLGSGPPASHPDTFAAASHAASQQDDPLDLRAELLESLSFPQMDDRRETIGPAYTRTCIWLLTHPAYMDWIDPEKYRQHNGLLWIKGKPGAGKSTLMKYAFVQARRSPRNREILLAYFFNARGSLLERSTAGMYRSLLYQLVQKTNIQPDVDDRAPAGVWTIDQLRELLTYAIEQLGGTYIRCYIDALDECAELEVRDMITHFRDLGEISDGRFRVCFASRYYPTIVIAEGDGLQIFLEDESGHGEDLVKYIKKRLHIGTGKARIELEAEILRKANSVFMWAVLVIDILNEEFRRGSVFNVRRRLNEIPEELSALFENILLRDHSRRDDLLLCIQWVLFAKQPLELTQFYFAMAAGLANDDHPREWDPELTSLQEMKRYVSDSSKGLTEVTKSRGRSMVQFIHESVRDFLLKDGGIKKLWPELEASPESSSHDRLRKCCQKALDIHLDHYITPMEHPLTSKPDAEGLSRLKQTFPFLQYATDHVFYHADRITDETIADDFLSTFDYGQWVGTYNVMQKYKIRRITQNASPWYVLANQNSASLIKRLHQPGVAMPPSHSEVHRHPLLAAIAAKNWAATRAILELCDSPRLEEAMTSLKERRDTSVGTETSPLFWAIYQGCEPLAEVLAASSLVNTDFLNRNNHTPLSLAATKGFRKVVEHIWSRSRYQSKGRRALVCAASMGHHKIVELLLSGYSNDRPLSDPDTESNIQDCGMALVEALEGGHTDVAKLILTTFPGVSIEHCGIALRATLQRGDIQMAELLLTKYPHLKIRECDAIIQGCNDAIRATMKKGHIEIGWPLSNACAEVSNQDNIQLLSAASTGGHVGVLKLLLHAGLEYDALTYEESLRSASSNGHTDCVNLLLDIRTKVYPDGDIADTLHDTLNRAFQNGHEEVLKSLLRAGASLSALRDDALYDASSRGHIGIVKLLLDHGVDVNAQESSQGSALYAAAQKGQLTVVQTLLSVGADVNAHGGKYGNALQAATILLPRKTLHPFESNSVFYDYQMQLMQLEQRHKKRLLMARQKLKQLGEPARPFEVVQALLAAGADVNAQGGIYGNALCAASHWGNLKMVQLLLDAGADVNAQGAHYGNALCTAAQQRSLLSNAGTDIDALERDRSALSIALMRGFGDVAELLKKAHLAQTDDSKRGRDDDLETFAIQRNS